MLNLTEDKRFIRAPPATAAFAVSVPQLPQLQCPASPALSPVTVPAVALSLGEACFLSLNPNEADVFPVNVSHLTSKQV